jgi:hypothetical protein
MVCCYKVLNYIHACDSHYFLHYLYVLIYLQYSYSFLLNIRLSDCAVKILFGENYMIPVVLILPCTLQPFFL